MYVATGHHQKDANKYEARGLRWILPRHFLVFGWKQTSYICLSHVDNMGWTTYGLYVDYKPLTYWCLVGNGWEWMWMDGSGIIFFIVIVDQSLIPY